MRESAWEASARREKKKLLMFSFFIAAAAAVAGVIVINNSDLLKLPILPKPLRSEEKTPHRLQNKKSDNKYTDSTASSFSYVTDSGESDIKPYVDDNKPPEQVRKSMEPAPESFSIELPSIPCRIESRKDIVIYLSLELFFNEIEKRPSILLRRDDIKVIVKRTLQPKEIKEMKIRELEAELLQEIKGLFDNGEITDLKIRNIEVEKAKNK